MYGLLNCYEALEFNKFSIESSAIEVHGGTLGKMRQRAKDFGYALVNGMIVEDGFWNPNVNVARGI